MRSAITSFALGLLLGLVAVAQNAGAQDPRNDHRRSMGNLRPDSYTAGQAVHGSGRISPQQRTRTVVVPQPYYVNPSYHYYHGYPSYYPRYYGYYPQYGYGYRGYMYPPPVAIPAETLYGPQAVRRFMGW